MGWKRLLDVCKKSWKRLSKVCKDLEDARWRDVAIPLVKEIFHLCSTYLPASLRHRLLTPGAYLYVRQDGSTQQVLPESQAPPQVKGSIRCVCISDTHLEHRCLKLPSGDILLHAGDILRRNRVADAEALRQIDDFNQWMSQQRHPHRVCVAGNHDGAFVELGAEKIRQRLTGCIYLLDESVWVGGVFIHGSPVSHGSTKNDAFQPHGGVYDDVAAIAKIPCGLDILMTHGPAGEGQLGRGVKDLDKRVDEVKPQFHVFGHVHPCHGVQHKNGVTLINASVADTLYNATHVPIVFDVVPRRERPE